MLNCGIMDTKYMIFKIMWLKNIIPIQFHNKKPWILIDEYDAPINNAYMNFTKEDLI